MPSGCTCFTAFPRPASVSTATPVRRADDAGSKRASCLARLPPAPTRCRTPCSPRSPTHRAVLPARHADRRSRGDGQYVEAVTDGAGSSGLPVRVGTYRTAQLQGFQTVTRKSSCSWRSSVTISIELAPATLQETVTVTGEAPLVDTTASTVGATSTRGRCRSCRSTAATGWISRCWRRAPPQRGEQHRAEPAGLFADQRRRAAGYVIYHSRRRQRSAELEPRRDRGVRGGRQSLRCLAGAFVGDGRERHHQVGHEHICRHGWRLLPGRSLQRGGFHQQRVVPTRTSR